MLIFRRFRFVTTTKCMRRRCLRFCKRCKYSSVDWRCNKSSFFFSFLSNEKAALWLKISLWSCTTSLNQLPELSFNDFFSLSLLFARRNGLNISSERLHEFFEWISHLTITEKSNCPNHFKEIELELRQSGYMVDNLMKEVTQPCAEMLTECNWLSDRVDCERLFHLSLTSEGYCCSFNYFGPAVE